ncbi:MAG: hypothetical protein IAF02_03840 [Anaerolineae bacterium]|nr:hypothetical protein [Anaerolineae bacterium]
MKQNEEQLFVCDLTAIPAEVREQHLASLPKLFQAAQDVQELPNGYAFKFQNEPGRFKSLANFIEYEQLCCPFEGLAVEIEASGGPIWLRLTGEGGYKEALKEGLQDMRGTIDSIQRIPGDEDMFEATVTQLTPTMTALMAKSARHSHKS